MPTMVNADGVAARGWVAPTRARRALPALLARHRVALAVLLLSGCAAASAQGFGVPLPLGELIATADAIVAGSISELGDATFTLEIEDALAGEIEAGTIEIGKFAAPVDNPRWADYAKGQRIVVFLAKGPSEPPGHDRSPIAWEILGRLGEGEIALEGGYAYFHRRYVAPLPPDYYSFHGQTSYLQRIELDTLSDAIRDYRTCFDWPEGAPGEVRPRLSCALSELCAFSGRSPLHGFLVQETDTIRERRAVAADGEGI